MDEFLSLFQQQKLLNLLAISGVLSVMSDLSIQYPNRILNLRSLWSCFKKNHLFFAISVRENQSKFEFQPIRTHYFEIWIVFYTLPWQEKDTSKLGTSLVIGVTYLCMCLFGLHILVSSSLPDISCDRLPRWVNPYPAIQAFRVPCKRNTKPLVFK